MTLQQYADDLVPKSCKVADMFDELTLNDVIIKGVDPSIGRSLRSCWSTNARANLTDIAFQTE